MRDSLNFALKDCTALQRIGISFYIEHAPALPDFVPVWYNKHIWEPSIAVLLAAPPRALTRIRIHISFSPFPLSTHSSAYYLPLRELKWDLLDRVVDRHPDLEVLELQFPPAIPLFKELRQTVQERLSSRVRRLVQFSLSPDFDSW